MPSWYSFYDGTTGIEEIIPLDKPVSLRGVWYAVMFIVIALFLIATIPLL